MKVLLYSFLVGLALFLVLLVGGGIPLPQFCQSFPGYFCGASIGLGFLLLALATMIGGFIFLYMKFKSLNVNHIPLILTLGILTIIILTMALTIDRAQSPQEVFIVIPFLYPIVFTTYYYIFNHIL